jgi:hypothetical protein
MMLSQVIATLTKAKKAFGDVPVNLIDSETGNNIPIAEIFKNHPLTQGLFDRSEPVNGVVISRTAGNSADLVLT